MAAAQFSVDVNIMVLPAGASELRQPVANSRGATNAELLRIASCEELGT